MQLKSLLKEEQAVSPVIGVILMVAITVILAAVIGTFVLGLGDQIQTQTPQVSFQFDYTDATNDEVTITHGGGDSIPLSEIDINLGGTEVLNDAGTDIDGTGLDTKSGDSAVPSDPWTAGGSYMLAENGNDDSVIADGVSVRVIWQNPDSDKSAIIGSGTVGF